jgi:hypothetical protein
MYTSLTIEKTHASLGVDRTICELVERAITVYITRRHTFGMENKRDDSCDASHFVSAAKGDQPAHQCQSEGTPCTLANSEESFGISVHDGRVFMSLQRKSVILSKRNSEMTSATHPIPSHYGIIKLGRSSMFWRKPVVYRDDNTRQTFGEKPTKSVFGVQIPAAESASVEVQPNWERMRLFSDIRGYISPYSEVCVDIFVFCEIS